LSAGIPCARWRPIVEYTFVGRNGEEIISFNSVQRLHFTPDDTNVQATTLIHDCTKNEAGTTAEPCIYTASPWTTFTIPPGTILGAFGPGIQLMNNQNPLTQEVMAQVVSNGTVPGLWDNLHLTDHTSVVPPVPIPPGCPECVHIHWRWAKDF